MGKRNFSKTVLTAMLGFGIVVSSSGLMKVEAATTDASNQLSQITTKYTKQLDKHSNSKELKGVLRSIEKSKEVKKLPKEQKIKILESVLSSAPKKVVEEYQEDKTKEINDFLTQETNIGDEYTSKEVVLEDGSSVIFSSTDNLDNDNLMTTFGSYEIGPFVNTTKEYGDRRYTAHVTLKSVGVTVATLVLANHYSVGTYGLKMRYASVAGTNGTFLSEVDAECEVTDSKAEKVGYDMNAVGHYKLTGKLNGGYIDLVSYIKLVQWDKSKKTVFVNQKIEYRD